MVLGFGGLCGCKIQGLGVTWGYCNVKGLGGLKVNNFKLHPNILNHVSKTLHPQGEKNSTHKKG